MAAGCPTICFTYGSLRPMARTETLVQLTEPLLELLDRVAAEKGVSRSQLIREAVVAHLGAQRRAEVDRRMAEGYLRLPQSEPEGGWSRARRMEAWADLDW